MKIYEEEEFSELLLTYDHLNCREEEVWEELMAWIVDNKGDMVKMAQMMKTIINIAFEFKGVTVRLGFGNWI